MTEKRRGRQRQTGDQQAARRQRAAITHSISQIQDMLAQEAHDMAQVARHTRRAAHVRAALHLAESTHYAHLACEALAGIEALLW